MNRRRFAVMFAAGALVGCERQKAPSADVEAALQQLESAIDDLEGNVGNFDDENWRDVVPDVETASTDVRDAFDALKRALAET